MRHDNPWDVRNPSDLISEVLRRGSPRDGDVLVAMLDRGDSSDSAPQRVLDVVRVHRGPLPDRADASDRLHDHALQLAGERPFVDGRWMPPQNLLVTLAFRSGRVIPGPQEFFWLMAWRYSNHNSLALDGDVYLVTEHGWTGCHDRRAGFSPALEDSTAKRFSILR